MTRLLSEQLNTPTVAMLSFSQDRSLAETVPFAGNQSRLPLLKAPLKKRWSIHQDSGFRCDKDACWQADGLIQSRKIHRFWEYCWRRLSSSSRKRRNAVYQKISAHDFLLPYHFKAHYPKREIMAARLCSYENSPVKRSGRCRQSRRGMRQNDSHGFPDQKVSR